MRLELKRIKKSYHQKTVLDIDSLVLEDGKIYAILGPNGSGKTTLLRIMAGIDKPCYGNIYYNGAFKSQGNDIAYMPQNVYLFDKTVMANIMLGIKSNGCSIDEARVRAKQALASVGMSHFWNVKARSLSGGEAQRIALARTLALRKSLVFLDEPASATDIVGMELVEKYIKTENRTDGATIVFTTHNPSQAARIADEAIIMHYGKVIETGTPGQVFNSPQRPETADFLKSWRI